MRYFFEQKNGFHVCQLHPEDGNREREHSQNSKLTVSGDATNLIRHAKRFHPEAFMDLKTAVAEGKEPKLIAIDLIKASKPPTSQISISQFMTHVARTPSKVVIQKFYLLI